MVNILFQDKYLIVAEKPPGVPSQPDKTGDADMLSLLRTEADEVFPVHRLDRPVSGVMVFAKTQAAAAKLSDGEMKKTYLAAVCGSARDSADLTHWLIKNQRLNISKAVPKNTPSAKEARLSYKKIAETKSPDDKVIGLLEVDLQTGRHHQIRVQLAASGLPIWGDTKYNPAFARVKSPVSIGLASYKLEFSHPFTGEHLCFIREPYNREPFGLFRR